MEITSVCPYCGKEMRDGAIPVLRDIYWCARGEDGMLKDGFGDEKEQVCLGRAGLLGDYYTPARYCESCKVVIVPVPEIEWPLDKLDKKFTAWQEETGKRPVGGLTMKFVLATQNPKKLKEMSAILGELGVEVVSEADLGVKIEVEETGETFAENSLLKAKAVMEATKLPAIADDSGLCVDALNGGPGVYSARFGGEGLDDTGRYRLLLQMMHGQADRRFHTTITCAFPNGDVLQDDGEVEGTIAFAPMGENGFGYDPVFFVPDKRKTFAQLSAEEKAEISHRGKALRAFKETLRNYLAEHQ